MRHFMTLVALTLAMSSTQAKVRLPHILSDNMILQQNSEARLWGWDKPGKEVKVSMLPRQARTASGLYLYRHLQRATLPSLSLSMMEKRLLSTAFCRVKYGYAQDRVTWRCLSRDSETAP